VSFVRFHDCLHRVKKAIVIFATVLKINSALQAAKINYDTNYMGQIEESFENPFF
jgi:hypothetical protein